MTTMVPSGPSVRSERSKKGFIIVRHVRPVRDGDGSLALRVAGSVLSKVCNGTISGMPYLLRSPARPATQEALSAVRVAMERGWNRGLPCMAFGVKGAYGD